MKKVLIGGLHGIAFRNVNNKIGLSLSNDVIRTFININISNIEFDNGKTLPINQNNLFDIDSLEKIDVDFIYSDEGKLIDAFDNFVVKNQCKPLMGFKFNNLGLSEVLCTDQNNNKVIINLNNLN